MSSPSLAPCWFCHEAAVVQCSCGRTFCRPHGLAGHCMLCALSLGIYERAGVQEPVSDLIILSLGNVTDDPYIVTPPDMAGQRPLSVEATERLLVALLQVLRSQDPRIRGRAATALANTTNSWPTMNPSRLSGHDFSTSLLAADQVRRWLLHALKEARNDPNDAPAMAILGKLRTADFRDLHRDIVKRLQSLTCASAGTRVSDVFQAIIDFYPTSKAALNEQCELLVYEQYANRQHGAGAIMERMYGPRLRYSYELGKMLKMGVYHTSYARFREWYPDEDEPY